MLVLSSVTLRAASCLLVVGALTCAPTIARAGDNPGDTERARALFEEAGELERHGQWSAAQERLRAALRLRETPQLYYALGWALENDDKLIEAQKEYETAVRLGKERSNGEEAARLASARLVDLEKKMPIIKIRVSGGARASVRVIVDGRDLKTQDDIVTTPVNPGSHVIRVDRGPEGAIEQMVYVGRSTVRTVDVDAGEVVASRDKSQDRHGRTATAMTISDRSSATSGSGDGVVPWLLLSGGLAFLAGGGALLVSADADGDTRDELQAKWCTATACSGNSTATRPETAEAAQFRRDASDAASTGNTKQAVGLVIGGLGLIGTTVGAILLLRGDSKKSPTVGAVRASASPIPGGGYASAAFTF